MWKDPKWLIGTVIAAGGLLIAIAAFAVPLLSHSSPVTPQSIKLAAPTVTPTTFGHALQILGIRPGGLSKQKLQQPGFIVVSDVTTSGYKGTTFLVKCTASDLRTGALGRDQHFLRVTGGAETTEPCWVLRRGLPTDRYTVNIAIWGKQNVVQTRNVLTNG